MRMCRLLRICTGRKGLYCMNRSQLCGDHRCCCSERLAAASCKNHGKQLNYIPHFPSYVTTLNFNYNFLPDVTKKTFYNLTKLKIKVLGLIGNDIVNFSRDSFAELRYMRKLDLDNNIGINKTSLSEAFESLPATTYFRLSLINTGLRNVSEISWEKMNGKTVRYIDISNNYFAVFDLESFQLVSTLAVLYARSCSIGTLNIGLGHQHLWNIDISDNKIDLKPYSFCYGRNDTVSLLPNLGKLILRKNHLDKSNENIWKCLPNLWYLELRENYITTLDNNSYAYLGRLKILRLSDMNRRVKHLKLSALNNSNLEELYLGGNRIRFERAIAKSVFKLCRKLKVINLSYNSFVDLTNGDLMDMFSPLRSLEKITIQSSNMSLPDRFLTLFPKLTYLNMDNNKRTIHSIDEVFKHTTSLTDASLKGNSIQIVKEAAFEGITSGSIRKLNLADNPFDCTCELRSFSNTISSAGRIGNITFQSWPNGYICARPMSKRGLILQKYRPTKSSCQNITLIALVSLGSVVVLALTVAIIVYRYRWYIAYWVYKTRTHPAVKESTPLLGDTSTDNDGYIIYDSVDEDFVHNTFRLLIEEKFGYKMLIWERDVPAGQAKLEAMVDAIYASRNVIAVVSASTLQDKWFHFQLTVAMDRQIVLGRDFVMLVILEDVKNNILSNFWCVMFTKLPSARWCSEEEHIQRRVLEQKLQHQLNRQNETRLE